VKAREGSTEAASRPTAQQRLQSAVVRDAARFASLKEEWDELYESCPSATPFSSWEWLYSWWEAYEEGYGLRLVTLREEASGLLVGLLPLMARRGRLLLLGGDRMTLYNPITPYKDVLIREGWEEPVAQAAARALKEMGGWHVADLQELMPHSAAWNLFNYWDGPKTSVPITDYLLMHAVPWEELLTSLSRRLRKTARRTLRQAEQDGLRCEPASVEDAERAASTLVELHRELWGGRRIDPEDLTPRYEAFMRAAARRMTARGIGRISEFWRESEVLVSQFLLFDKDFVGAYVIGASEEGSRRYQLETLTNWDAIEVANRRGSEYVSMMFHASRDKLRWADEVVSSHRAILGHHKAFWLPYAAYYLMRDRYYSLLSDAQVYVHSEGAPRWVKKATQSYYALVLYPYSEDAPRWVKKATQRYYALRREYGYYALRYRYELAQARREIRKSDASHTPTKR
jgi:CelD/BcsL family acetyltransferase involved in cellulose biosynthesis